MKKYFVEQPFETLFPPGGSYTMSTDREGVILIEYSHRSIGKVYHPVAVSLYALSQYNNLVEKHEEKCENDFLTHAAWLSDNLVEKGHYGVWYYNFRWVSPGYVCNPPWVSSMAQGLGISVLVRAWSITHHQKYMRAAEKAAASFDVPVSQGGILVTDERGEWYEEFACQKKAHVLNGFVFALIGVYELYECSKNEKFREIFDRGVKTLKEHLRDFELNLLFFKWSRYDNRFLLYSGDKYHQIHIKQLEELYAITKEEVFHQYSTRWKSYVTRYGQPSSRGKTLFTAVYPYYMRVLNFLQLRRVKK